jgi:hypothetical protein
VQATTTTLGRSTGIHLECRTHHNVSETGHNVPPDSAPWAHVFGALEFSDITPRLHSLRRLATESPMAFACWQPSVCLVRAGIGSSYRRVDQLS